MNTTSIAVLVADFILLLHLAFVGFVIVGVIAIYAGYVRGWAWVRGFWWRILHVVAIVYVVVQTWLGEICPLTLWETQLRELAGEDGYQGSFVQYWMHALLYYDAPGWVFSTAYTCFGALVVATWFVVPPMRKN